MGGSVPSAGPAGPRAPRPALQVSVTQRAVDGAATAAAERALARALGIPAGRVRVVRGFTSRDKTVEIDPGGPAVSQAWDRLLDGGQ